MINNNLMGGGGTLSGRRRFMSMRKNNPYDAEIEYLECSNSQWIETEISGPTDYFEITFEALSGRNGNIILNCWDTYVWNKYLLTVSSIGGTSIHFGTEEKRYNITLQTKYKVIFNNDLYQLFNQEGELLHEVTNNANSPTSTFKLMKSGTYYGICRIYDFKIPSVIDLIPVRIGQEGFMYDRVSGKLFGNAGTGKFLLGPDI